MTATTYVSKIYVSKPIRVDTTGLKGDYKRADIVFHGVDHSGASFEARVFLNKPEANENTPKTPENGYAGSFHILGHGQCYGDVGHCDIPTEQRLYDPRPSHPLTPVKKVVVATDA